ncbi:MAG TPA: HAD-IIIC family phosphatase [Candidatus Binataceae bacterium]|nr:HAD-IIIC family phosphatase [Candidatus Binataceae bacterium]
MASQGLEGFSQRETYALVDYLIRYLRTGDPTWRDLYVGERLKQLYLPKSTKEEDLEHRRRVMALDRRNLLELLNPQLEGQGRQQLAAVVDGITAIMTAPDGKEVRILLVGDCLFLDILAFLATGLREDGIAARTTFATSKNPLLLRETLRKLKNENFALIFYSPYTYEFDLLLAQTHYLRSTKLRGLRKIAVKAHEETAYNLGLLREMFECPIIVHNTANVRRHDSSFGSRVRNVLTYLFRQLVARHANALLESTLKELNRSFARPVLLIDERPLLSEHGDLGLGAKFYDSDLQHPAVFGKMIAPVYRDVIGSAAYLFGRKVIVTDLDHTLWTGLIGEGAVEHDHSRQKTLKLLQRKGILLAIASKNDPRKVKWDGGLLNAEDFVAAQINWDPKPGNLERIAAELNLKLKDFVFIDDRPDEREMVRLAMPQVLTLDPASARTWHMLEWWAASIPDQAEGDRTQIYRERRQRQQFLEGVIEREAPEALLANLNLRLKIRNANPADLTRAAELINRTNQFNVCNSRTNRQEMAGWSSSGRHRIILGEAADKFGAMGIVSVIVVELGAEGLEVLVWVLSCRVFGFGMETAMLNYLKHLAVFQGQRRIIGRIIETPFNEPCRGVYRENGFLWKAEAWEFEDESTIADPAWLAVSVDYLEFATRAGEQALKTA